mmetsp:Transcript_45603/g.126022  ORF Transcript_45603/g.126022 Transcript_45603/m.126022 type:complete len:83 (-) Transcript_45603:615-863(-)
MHGIDVIIGGSFRTIGCTGTGTVTRGMRTERVGIRKRDLALASPVETEQGASTTQAIIVLKPNQRGSPRWWFEVACVRCQQF